MRAIWSGSISFGLVNIPVKLYSASEDRALSFDMLHKEDMSPIRYARICKKDGKEIPYEEIIKGYEYYEGNYVPIEEKDFEKAYAKRVKTIEVLNFVKEEEVDPILYDKPYYLEPGKGADKPFALLREALSKSKKVAIAKFVLRNKEHLAMLKPKDEIIFLDQLRFAQDVRQTSELKKPQVQEISTRELTLALDLINKLTSRFKPDQFHDTFTDQMKKIIINKSKGKMPVRVEEEPQPTEVADLMAALTKSLEREKQRGR